MRQLWFGLAVLFCVGIAVAQSSDSLPVQRTVTGERLESGEAPKATLEFAKEFKYLGGQRFPLYGVAEAEQHFFVKLAQDGSAAQIYWVQFEHYLPSNTHTYEYKPERTTALGDFQFIYDTEAFNDYSVTTQNPQSDAGKARAFLAKNRLDFPKHMARIRMFNLPNPDRRSELMIIYAEAFPGDLKLDISEDGTPLDEQSPEVAKMIRDHALAGLKISKR